MRHASPLPSVPLLTLPRCPPYTRFLWRPQLITLRVHPSRPGGALYAHPTRYRIAPIVE
jgi:hypothetical protein